MGTYLPSYNTHETPSGGSLWYTFWYTVVESTLYTLQYGSMRTG